MPGWRQAATKHPLHNMPAQRNVICFQCCSMSFMSVADVSGCTCMCMVDGVSESFFWGYLFTVPLCLNLVIHVRHVFCYLLPPLYYCVTLASFHICSDCSQPTASAETVTEEHDNWQPLHFCTFFTWLRSVYIATTS